MHIVQKEFGLHVTITYTVIQVFTIVLQKELATKLAFFQFFQFPDLPLFYMFISITY